MKYSKSKLHGKALQLKEFYEFSLLLSLSWASGPLQPKSGFLIILPSEMKGLALSAIQ